MTRADLLKHHLAWVAYALPKILLGTLAMVLGVVQPWKKRSA